MAAGDAALSVVSYGTRFQEQPADGERTLRSGTLRKEYGDWFLPGFRSTTRLDAVLKKTGAESLHKLLKKKF
jgi:hypothetical protein